MTAALPPAPALPAPRPSEQRRQCVRCKEWTDTAESSCRNCFAPLNDCGVLVGLERPFRADPGVMRNSMFACVALAGALFAAPKLFQKPAALRAPAALSRAGQTITVPVIRRAGLGKFEPEHGCFIGAFVSQDINVDGSMTRWEEVTGKGHASYLRYVGYGQPFPKAWVEDVRRVGAVPNIAFEPNEGLKQVRENAYLRQWARDAAESGGPVFLRFASEMNGEWTAYHGNPQKYRGKFRLVSRVMHEQAPNVAMVWTPYCLPLYNLRDYYPGDEAVDWVGVNIYSVHHHNGNPDKPAQGEDPTYFLQQVYSRYARRKPIQVSEFASTHVCAACGEDTPDFAIRKMQQMYLSLPKRFPRVKMIYWFSWDTIAGGTAENNYSVVDNPEILESYRRIIASSYFLPRIPEGEYWELQPEPPLEKRAHNAAVSAPLAP